MDDFDCESCNNKTDCDEYDSQAVKDVSKRCGLVCHSSISAITISRPEPPICKKCGCDWNAHFGMIDPATKELCEPYPIPCTECGVCNHAVETNGDIDHPNHPNHKTENQR